MPQNPSAPRQLLNRLRQMMATSGSARERLDKVVQIIAGNMVADVCSVYLRTPDNELELVATEGLRAEAVSSTRMKFDEGLVGQSAMTAEPLNIQDAPRHPAFSYRPETGEDPYHAFLGVPVLRGGRVMGVLTVQNRTEREYGVEEIEALEAADISYRIVPGITAASAAVANIGQSLTKRGRNSAIRLITGHDTKGYADHDWTALAQPGEVAAIYMGKKSARFIQGRLLMHGADPTTPVTIIENVSRADQQIIATTLAELEPTLTQADLHGPAITFYGLAPRDAASQIENIREFA